jgi:hypothetical protein
MALQVDGAPGGVEDMSTTKLSISYYLNGKGYTDFKISKSGDFFNIALWDVVTFDEVEKIRTGLQEICGKIPDPKFSFLERAQLHCGNVRFSK